MPESTSPLSLQQQRQFDTLREQFAGDWQQQRRPSIEEYLERAESTIRQALTAELLRIELDWRLRLGEQPSAEEYATRYPTLADSLPDYLSTARLAHAGPDATTATPPDTLAPTNDSQTEQTQGHIPSSPAAPDTPRRVGEYDLVELLGEGGMGQVWKARHRRLGKLVALKLIRPGSQHSADNIRRFLREMKAIGELDHPNVVEASDAGECDGTVYLAMKLIDGQDLAKYVRQHGPLPLAEACGLARQVAAGLQYLHERGLVHRDLKPANLIRTPEGTVKVLDLGLARWQADTVNEYTQTGQSLGTPDYMAPEQISHAAGVDIRADLYGLGATLFFLLAGRPPFGHLRGAFEKMKAHESTPPPDVRTLRPDVPAELAGLVARLLAKKPADRPATPAEVAGALRPFALVESPAPVPHEPAPHPRRRLLVLALGLALALLIGGALLLTLGPRFRADSEPEKPLAGEKPATVLRFDVAHAARSGDVAEERGLLGINSFSTRLGDRARVTVTLSRPACGYLLAYAADGKEYLLDPPDETDVPKASAKLVYPPVGKAVEYDLSDGVGLHVFLAVVGKEALPSYAQWRKEHGPAPWARAAARQKAVWRQVGGDLHAATQADPDVRGPGAAALGVAPVERLAGWWRKRPGVAEVCLTGFAVTRAE